MPAHVSRDDLENYEVQCVYEFQVVFCVDIDYKSKRNCRAIFVKPKIFFFFGGGGGGVIRHTFGSFIDLIMASVTFWPDFGV